MNIVCFGQQNWDYCWTAKQQLMTRLARRGHRVLYVDPDWDRSARGARESLALLRRSRRANLHELLAGRLHRFTYRYVPALGWRLNVQRYRRQLGRIVQELHFTEPVALALRPDALAAMDAVAPVARVYYAVDEWTAFGGYSDAERAQLRNSEEQMLRRTDLALAVSPRLHERMRRVQPNCFRLVNGADTEHFAPERALRLRPHPVLDGIPRPRICLLGQIDERVDLELLLTLARARPDWQLLLVGRVVRVDVTALAALPNVHLLGYHAYEELPRILRDVDACMLPYRSTELTESCDPLKVYEYLAAGKPVVAVPLEGLRSCREGIRFAQGPAEFLATLDAVLADPQRDVEQRLAIARQHDWSRRADELLERLEQARRSAKARPPRGVRGHELHRLPGAPEDYDDYGFRGRRVAIGSFRGRCVWWATRLLGRGYHALRLLARAARGRPARIRRILVVRHAYLGDLVVFTAALQALRSAYPDARIVLGVQRGMNVAGLITNGRLVDEVQELDFLADPSRLRKLLGIARLFATGYDAVLFGLGFFLREEAFFAGAPYCMGIYNGHAWQRLLSRALPLDRTQHEVDVNVRLVEMLAGRTLPVPPPRLFTDEMFGRKQLVPLLARLGVPSDAPLLAIHPGARKASRRWPLERFAEVARRILLQRPALHVVLLGVPSERPLAMRLIQQLPDGLRTRVHNAAAMTDLPALIALVQRCRAVLCNDSGIMHLTRTVGTPLLALLGPENDARWGPYRDGPGPAVALRMVVPCSPCARKICEHHLCMRSLDVDLVHEHLVQLLAQAAARPGRSAEAAAAAVDHPVVVHRLSRSFGELAAAGFELPAVSVVNAPPQLAHLLLGGPARPGTWRRRTAPIDAAYPSIEAIQVAAAAATLPAEDRGVALLADSDPATAWRELLALVSGELLAVAEPDESWGAGEIAEHVAALLRQPLAVASVTRPDGNDATRSGRGLLRLTHLQSLIGDWLAETQERSTDGAREPLLAWLERRHIVMRIAVPPLRGGDRNRERPAAHAYDEAI